MGLGLVILVGFASCVVDIDRADRESRARIEKQRQLFTGPSER